MKPKKLFPRPNIITPALQLGLTDVSENKQKTNKKWKTIRRSKQLVNFFCNTEPYKILFCLKEKSRNICVDKILIHIRSLSNLIISVQVFILV